MTMTPSDYYKHYRDKYYNAFGIQWVHQTAFGENQSLDFSELLLRCGLECRALKASGMEENEMVANAVMIRETLPKTRKQHESN